MSDNGLPPSGKAARSNSPAPGKQRAYHRAKDSSTATSEEAMMFSNSSPGPGGLVTRPKDGPPATRSSLRDHSAKRSESDTRFGTNRSDSTTRSEAADQYNASEAAGFTFDEANKYDMAEVREMIKSIACLKADIPKSEIGIVVLLMLSGAERKFAAYAVGHRRKSENDDKDAILQGYPTEDMVQAEVCLLVAASQDAATNWSPNGGWKKGPGETTKRTKMPIKQTKSFTNTAQNVTTMIHKRTTISICNSTLTNTAA